MCEPSVLDRLNALLEPGGVLHIHEHPYEDGSPRIIKPHPNFRLFLAVSSNQNRLSKAMKNRCVEICVKSHYPVPMNDMTKERIASFGLGQNSVPEMMAVLMTMRTSLLYIRMDSLMIDTFTQFKFMSLFVSPPGITYGFDVPLIHILDKFPRMLMHADQIWSTSCVDLIDACKKLKVS